MKTAAFFDIDGTILAKNSGSMYIKFLVKEGKLGRADMARGMWWFFQYRLGLLNWEKISVKMTNKFAGDSEELMIKDCHRWYDAMVKQYARPEMIEAIEKHKKQNHRVALLTAATIYLARPLGEDLKIDDLICNRLEVRDGKFTGELVEPTCYGDGKLYHAEKFVSENGLSMEESYYYTDSITDLPVLLKVGHPVIVNPDPLLRREAKKRGWIIYDFDSR